MGVAALIQTLYIWGVHRTLLHNGDAVYYEVQARLVTMGHWFIDPYALGERLVLVPSAAHPPLTTLVLALANLAGAQSWTWHMIVMGAIFVLAVGVCGLVGNQLAGPRAGVVVALVVGVYPYLWVNPATVLAETLEILVLALLLWAALRFWRRPRPGTAIEIGVYLGLAALTRSELILLVLVIGLPLVLVTRGLRTVQRLGRLAVMGLAVLVVVGPWVGRNMTAFHHREYLASESGVTLATANCAQTYYGNDEGWWSFACPTVSRALPADADESDTDRALRTIGEHYIETHEARLPQVVLVRVLRTWDLYRPIQQSGFDQLDARPAWVTQLGMVSFYVLAPLAVGGAVLLRRRRVLVFPLLALILAATLEAAVVYANGRYRVDGDLAVAMLAGVGIDGLIGVRRPSHRPAVR